MNTKKMKIEQMFTSGNIENLYILIKEYENEYPYDLDLYAMKTNYYLCIGELDKALIYAKKGIISNPINPDMYYNLAMVSEVSFDLKSSYENYGKASILYLKTNNTLLQKQADNGMERVCAKIEDIYSNSKDIKLQKKMLDNINYMQNHHVSCYSMISHPFINYDINLINSIYNDGKGTDYFIAVYNRWTNFHHQEEDASTFGFDLMRRKGEFIKIHTASNECEFNEECDILLPIFYEKTDKQHLFNTYRFHTKLKYYDVIRFPNHFNYFRLPGKVKVESLGEYNSIIGNPILLKQDPNKKKLVLNIFVDSLPQILFDLPDFMPYTKAFFKKGVICNNVYADAEYTVPSAATIFSGLNSAHHMFINPGVRIPFSKDITLISEYYQKEGYYTTKIGSNYGLPLDRGYLRGFDRLIYQHAKLGLNFDELISDTIEHLKMANETNQFLWIDVFDLHDISSGYDLPPSVQAEIFIDDMAGYRTEDDLGVKSVKRVYNEHSINLFKLMAQRVDFALLNLYNYISNNYEDNDIVISLFSDHGLAFMVNEKEHFFTPARSNTTLMLRSSFKQGTTCNEYISTTDYIEIMGRLSGIPISSTVDSNLPKFFGGVKERDYVLSHTLYPGDCYKVAIHSDKYSCYVDTEDIIGHDGRFDFTNYSIKIIDKDKNEVYDEELNEYFISEIKKNIAHLQHY